MKVVALLGFTCLVLAFLCLGSQGASLLVEICLFEQQSVGFPVSIVCDKVSLSFMFIVCFISLCVFAFSCTYMIEDPYFDRFTLILLSFVVSMLMLTLSGSLFMLLVGWDGLGITSFVLIVYYQSRESLEAGFQTLMVNRIGDSLIIVSSAIFLLGGSFSLFVEGAALAAVMSAAALTKSAQYPFSSWLPAAMAAPTPVSALVHSSTLVTAGVFLIIRLLSNNPLLPEVGSALLFCGSVTCLLGGWAATQENDLKKVVALSTLSQLGVMVYCLGLGLPSLSLFHLYTHALFKALLFLAAGVVLLVGFGTQDLRLMGSLSRVSPATLVFMNISSLCLIGTPFLSAFFSKHMMLEKLMTSSVNSVSFCLMLVSTALTSWYVVRMMKVVCWSGPQISTAGAPPSILPMVLLGVGGIFGGKSLIALDLANLNYSTSSMGPLLVTFAGLMLGLFSEKIREKLGLGGARGLLFLSSLFFLTPLLKKSVGCLPLKSLMTLDYGWLEPRNIPALRLSKVSAWATNEIFLRSGWVLFSGYLAYTYFVLANSLKKAKPWSGLDDYVFAAA